MSRDTPALLRAIQRLRSGLPPSERVRDLTVGDEPVCTAIEGWLHASEDSRWIKVDGNYGEGKTHTLALIREMSHERGFATCQLVADGASAALNHPQRFLPVLLAALELPGGKFVGYDHLLYQALMDADRVNEVRHSVQRNLDAGRVIEVEARLTVTHIERAVTSVTSITQEERERLIRLATLHLSGHSGRHRSATPDARMVAYRLLRVAHDLVVESGAQGLVVLLDEVESIYTKLANARSRRGAYRVLSALCHAQELAGLRVAVAITPDAEQQMHDDARDVSDEHALECEPVDAWRGSLASVEKLRCRPLTRSERSDLVRKIRSVFEATYGALSGSRDAGWSSFAAAVVASDVPVRLLVRRTIDFLDAQRYALVTG